MGGEKSQEGDSPIRNPTYHHPVGIHDCVKSVCNCQHRTVAKLTAYGFLNQGVCSALKIFTCRFSDHES